MTAASLAGGSCGPEHSAWTIGTRPGDSPGSRVREPSVKPVDQSVRFVEFVTQARHPAPGNQGSVTLHTSCAAFGGFHLFGDFVDVGV